MACTVIGPAERRPAWLLRRRVASRPRRRVPNDKSNDTRSVADKTTPDRADVRDRRRLGKFSSNMVKLRARCLLVGDAAVGKSALSQMFSSDGAHFQKNYSMTTGVELLTKSVNIPETNDTVELFIIDSAGRETFVEACQEMWGQPSLFFLVFDLTSEQSFANCALWVERVRAHCRGLHVPGVLVGNKSDLSGRRTVQGSVAQEWAQSQGLDYHETSAKQTENCDAPFLHAAQAFHSLYRERQEAFQSLKAVT